MADKKITDMTALAAGSQATGDLITVVDVSEPAAVDKNKKMTMENLFKGIPGNVGIGTTNPFRALVVSNGGAEGFEFHPAVSSNVNRFQSYNRSGSVYCAYRVDALQHEFLVGGNEKARIDSSGNVGIGTSAPEEIFHIKGPSEPVSSRDGVLLQHSTTSSDADTGLPIVWSGYLSAGQQNYGVASICGRKENSISNDGAGYLQFGTGNSGGTISERMRIDSSGNVGIGTSSPSANLHIDYESNNPAVFTIENNEGSFKLSANANLGLLDAAQHVFRNAAGSSEYARIDSSGNVGIGTTSPNALLHVKPATNENIRFIGGSGDTRISCLDDAVANTVQLSIQGNPLLFRGSGGLERARIDSSGRLFVGTTSAPTGSSTTYAKLVLRGNTINSNEAYFALGRGSAAVSGQSLGSLWFIDNADGQFARIDAHCDGTPGASDFPGRLSFWTTADGASSPTERMRIDNAGRLGIGVTPSDFGTNRNSLELHSSSGTVTHLALTNSTTNSNGSSNGFNIIQNGLNTLMFLRESGFMSFSTANAERMRIDSSGRLLVGRTSTTSVGSGSLIQTRDLSIEVGSDITGSYYNRTDSNAAWVAARFHVQGSEKGYIQVNTSSVTYSTSSDYRLKENVVGITNGIARVKQLQPKRFNFIAEPDKTVDGFLAHEAQAIVPECVTGTKDDVDADGNPVYQGIDQSKLVPLLTAALQEALAKIETLEAKVAALEAG